jgi:phospholipid/cholesterol/gamma-HCH transport system substrate-binding protein
MRRLAALLAPVVFGALLAGCGGSGMKITATFDDVGDLQKRHSVQVADVRVGSISSIKLTDDYKAKVTMSVDQGTKIPADSQAVLRTTSLLGEKFIEIRPRGNPTQGPYLSDGAVIKDTLEAPELEFVAEEAVQVLGAVNASDLATITETGAQAAATTCAASSATWRRSATRSRAGTRPSPRSSTTSIAPRARSPPATTTSTASSATWRRRRRSCPTTASAPWTRWPS